MKIKSVNIKNYRSIEDITIDFSKIGNNYSKILLGKNESGKSSILKALSLYYDKIEVNYPLDCNKQAFKTKEPIEVTYELEIDEKEIKRLKEGISNLPVELVNELNLSSILYTIQYTIKDTFTIIKINKEDIDVNILQKYLEAHNQISLIPDIYSNEEDSLSEKNINEKLPGYNFLTNNKVDEIIIDDILEEYLVSFFPNIIFWDSSDSYLINKPINLREFEKDLNHSKALKNIFNIAGIEDEYIVSRIKDAFEFGEERDELEETLSSEVTKHINSIWKEHKISIKISLETNNLCYVYVYDNDYTKPKYNMEQRSDGFKQFISILLILSAENKSNKLKNTLIILDEPEVHLHPSGIRYLRDELFEIAKKNNLIIATHSIYMIDKVNLERHFSVKKEKAVTRLLQIEKNNPYQEEVIYESLGTSVYEIIEPNVIIFEGKTDKDIFDIFVSKFENQFNIPKISTISADGVDSILKYVKFFNNKLIKGYVLVDADVDGERVKKQVLDNNDEFKESTFTINDIFDTSKKSTLEDLFPKSIIEHVLNEKFGLDLELDEKKPYILQVKAVERKLDDKKLKVEILKEVSLILNINENNYIEKEFNTYIEFFKSLISKIK